MTSLHPSEDAIDCLASETVKLIDQLAAIPHFKAPAMETYRSACLKIPGQIRSGLLKVAVIGVIKSGKSTFINAMVKRELVKRGAGVMTSITTRIRKGPKNRATLTMKSWDQINQALDKTLTLFPREKPAESFDLRRQRDREYLAGVYEDLEKEFPVTSEGIRPEALIIRNALDGYAHCSQVIQADETQIVFEGRSFEQHKQYTADPVLAFFVKDVCLEVYGKFIDPGIEIADCQGADSTDPAQLAQVISYIQGANLIVYCVSSRTGLRQADIGFLKTIRRMGLMGNVLFVNNCDLSEHDSIQDLKRIETGIEKELRYLVPLPRLFSFSALFNLFDHTAGLSPQDQGRLSLWKKDEAMARYSRDNTRRFITTYDTLLAQHRHELLYANPMERIRLTAKVLDENCNLVTELLSTDLQGQAGAKEKLKAVEENAQRLRTIVDNSIQGAISGLTREISENLKKAFLKDRANINQKIAEFINAVPMDVTPYKAGVKETGFKQILYLMFQDFKRQLDLYVLETIMPELKTLVETQEKRIETYFQSLLDSYQIEIPTLAPAGENVRELSVPAMDNLPERITAVDINAIKKILGLTLPDLALSSRFTTRMRANALTDLGLHSLILFLAALVDRHVRFSFTPGFGKAAQKIKKESLAMMQHQIKTLHLALRQTYFTPLIEAATRDFKEKILERFSRYDAINQDMDEIFRLHQEEKQAQLKIIGQAKETICLIFQRINQFPLSGARENG